MTTEQKTPNVLFYDYQTGQFRIQGQQRFDNVGFRMLVQTHIELGLVWLDGGRVYADYSAIRAYVEFGLSLVSAILGD